MSLIPQSLAALAAVVALASPAAAQPIDAASATIDGVATIGEARTTSAPPSALSPAGAAEELAAGKFLVATRKLKGPFFAESVVLLLEYSQQGALGLIVNRPTRVRLVELLPDVESLGERADKVHLGGPVDTRLLVFLIRSQQRPPDSQRVIDDVHASGSEAALRQLLKQNAPASRFHAYVGYAGWGPGQLDGEVARGDWHVAPAEADRIFDDEPAALWRELVRQHEGLQVRTRPPGAPLRIASASLMR